MKLYTAKASPFGRTVEIVAHELGLHEDIELVPTTVAPTKANDAFQAVTPLRKIPALELDDGTTIVDSTVIAEYLAARVGNAHLFAREAPHEWQVRSDYATAKGVAECAVATRYETFARPEPLRWSAFVDDQMDKIDAALARFDATPPESDGRLTIADIALGAALGYLDFRFAEHGWRDKFANLARWLEPLEERPSFVATQPG